MAAAKKTSTRPGSRRTSKPKPTEAEGADKSPEEEQELDQEEAGFICPKFDGGQGASFWQRVIWVRSNLPTNIRKDKKVGNQYKVLTHEQINGFLLLLLCEARLVDWVELFESELIPSGVEQANGRPIVFHHGRYTYFVQNAESADQNYCFPVEGIGEDAGDKGPGKASTYALKTGRKGFFSIAAGDDEEGRPDDAKQGIGKPKAAPLSPEHLDELLKVADELFGDDSSKAIANLCKSPGFMASEVSQIPDKFFNSAVKLLQRWKESRQKRAAKKPADGDANSDIPTT